MLLLNGGSQEGTPCEDGKDHRGKEVRQVYSEEDDLCYLSTVPTRTLMCT